MKKGKYRSKFEASIAKDLRSRKVSFQYESTTIDYELPVVRGVCYECGSNDVRTIRRYTPDFIVNRGKTFIEAKGRLTSRDRNKMVSVKRSHPTVDVRMLFQRDGWVNRKTKQRYSDWCEKHNIAYAIGTVPSDWVGGK